MISLLLALALSASAQEPAVSTAAPAGISNLDRQRLDAIDQAVQDLYLGKPVLKGSPQFDEIRFADGTTQTTAATSSGGVVVSTEVYPNGTSAATTATGECQIASSSATFTVTGGSAKARVCFTGSGSSGASHQHFVYILVDGDFLPGYVKKKIVGQTNANANPTNLSFCVLTPVLAAGSHRICLGAGTSAGTLTIPDATNPIAGTAMLSVGNP